MHELSIAMSIVEVAGEEAERRGVQIEENLGFPAVRLRALRPTAPA